METLKTAQGRPYAQIYDTGSRLTIKTMNGQIKGSYDKRMDATFDAQGRKISTGNALLRLL